MLKSNIDRTMHVLPHRCPNHAWTRRSETKGQHHISRTVGEAMSYPDRRERDDMWSAIRYWRNQCGNATSGGDAGRQFQYRPNRYGSPTASMR